MHGCHGHQQTPFRSLPMTKHGITEASYAACQRRPGKPSAKNNSIPGSQTIPQGSWENSPGYKCGRKGGGECGRPNAMNHPRNYAFVLFIIPNKGLPNSKHQLGIVHCWTSLMILWMWPGCKMQLSSLFMIPGLRHALWDRNQLRQLRSTHSRHNASSFPRVIFRSTILLWMNEGKIRVKKSKRASGSQHFCG